MIDALDGSSFARKTVVVLWSDHGYQLGELGICTCHSDTAIERGAPLHHPRALCTRAPRSHASPAVSGLSSPLPWRRGQDDQLGPSARRAADDPRARRDGARHPIRRVALLRAPPLPPLFLAPNPWRAARLGARRPSPCSPKPYTPDPPLPPIQASRSTRSTSTSSRPSCSSRRAASCPTARAGARSCTRRCARWARASRRSCAAAAWRSRPRARSSPLRRSASTARRRGSTRRPSRSTTATRAATRPRSPRRASPTTRRARWATPSSPRSRTARRSPTARTTTSCDTPCGCPTRPTSPRSPSRPTAAPSAAAARCSRAQRHTRRAQTPAPPARIGSTRGVARWPRACASSR